MGNKYFSFYTTLENQINIQKTIKNYNFKHPVFEWFWFFPGHRDRHLRETPLEGHPQQDQPSSRQEPVKRDLIHRSRAAFGDHNLAR